MGSLAKRLGQVAAKSLESEGANILRRTAANKIEGSLSLALDGTLKQGHDMKVFGLGTAASMANLPRYARFTSSMRAIYGAMETGMDGSPSIAVKSVWSTFSGDLRRAPSLDADLKEAHALLATAADDHVSPATAAYVAAINEAARSDSETNGARLLGHLYCR